MATPVADPAAIAAVEDILKETWPSDQLESQLLEETILLDWMDDVTEYTDSDGLRASVPLHTGRGGASHSRGIGQKLGPSGHQRARKASYNYTFHYVTVKVLGPIIAKMKTQRQAAVREIDFEVEGAITDAQQNLQRMLHSSGDAVLGVVGTTDDDAEVSITDAFGQHAIRCGWIYEGVPLDCGTAANPVASFQGQRVIDVDDENYTITLDAAVDTTAGHTISIYGNRVAAGEESFEMDGLGKFLDPTEPVGGIDPDTAGDRFWKPTVLANSGTPRQLSINLLLKVEQKLRQRGSKCQVVTGDLDQERGYYNLLEPKVRFIGDKKLSEGNLNGLEYNGKMFVGDPHHPPGKVRFLNKKYFFMVSAGKFAWQNTTTGGNILAWVQDEDAFVARAAKYGQLATNHRKGIGSLEDLETPA